MNVHIYIYIYICKYNDIYAYYISSMVLWSWIRPFYMFYTHISHTQIQSNTQTNAGLEKGHVLYELICLLASKCMTIFLILSWGQFFWAWHSHGPLLQAWTSARETCNISATAWMKMVFFWYTAHTLPETNIFAPETLELEDEFPFGFRPPARCELLVLGSLVYLVWISMIFIYPYLFSEG